MTAPQAPDMLRIIGSVYLVSLANGLLLLALERLLPEPPRPAREPGPAPEWGPGPDAGMFARYSMLLAAAGVALAGILQRWRGLP